MKSLPTRCNDRRGSTIDSSAEPKRYMPSRPAWGRRAGFVTAIGDGSTPCPKGVVANCWKPICSADMYGLDEWPGRVGNAYDSSPGRSGQSATRAKDGAELASAANFGTTSFGCGL